MPLASARRICDVPGVASHPVVRASRSWPRVALCSLLLPSAACGGAPPAALPDEPLPPAGRLLARRAYALSFEGARIGYATEEEREQQGTVELRRREWVRFRRDEELASFEIDLTLHGTATGGATRVEASLRQCVGGTPIGGAPIEPLSSSPPGPGRRDGDGDGGERGVPGLPGAPCPAGSRPGPLTTAATARRTAAGWRVRDLHGAVRTLPAEAQPAEWLDLAPRRAATAAPMLLFFATRQFAMGRAVRRWIDPRTWVGTVSLGDAILESTTELGDDGRPRLIVDSSGAVATRIAERELGQPVALVDLVALTTLPIHGGHGPANAMQPRRLRFTLARTAATPTAPSPPAAPGQRVDAEPGGWRVELTGQPASPFSSEERTLVRAMEAEAARLAGEQPFGSEADLPDTSGEPPDFDAPELGSDCTARALQFAAAARQRGWQVRLATGFFVDGATLVRHRWNVAWTGARWIAVDPSSGDAPAPHQLLALAIHDATAEALAAAEVVFTPLRGARVEWLP
jgi:hypothetical protein